jgi:hypothetical protein
METNSRQMHLKIVGYIATATGTTTGVQVEQ